MARRADPDDRRAKLVVHTAQGRRPFEASRTVIARIEADYARQVGDRGFQALRGALGVLAGKEPADQP